MNIIADLHIHGRFSRATSKNLTIKNLEKYARIKGVELLGSGDFTHPEWYKELKGELKEDGSSVKKGSYNILVVEDDFINQKLFNDLLIKKGYKVSTVDDGNKIFPLIEKTNFDLIIMDIQLFGMDGFTATSVLREKEKDTGGHIPVIGMTAFAMQGDREKCLEIGMDDYLPKPFDKDDFYNIIEKYLSRSD